MTRDPAALDLLLVGAFPFPLPFGSQVLAGGMARALARRGHAVRLATYGHGEGDGPEGVERVRPPALGRLGVLRSGPSPDRPLQDLLLLRAVRRTLAARPPDVIVAHHVEAVGVALAARRLAGLDVPVLYVCHTSLETELPDWVPGRLGGIAARAGALLDAGVARTADGALALSPDGARHLRDVGARRVWQVPPGVEPDEVRGGDAEAAHARWDLGDRPWVLYTGNLDRYQDLDLLVEAMASLPEAGLLVLTRDDPGDRFAAVPPDRLRVVRERGLDDLRDALAAAAVACVPRQVCPGFPMKVLNLLAAGVPVVCAAATAPPVEGVLPVGGRDPAAFAGALRAALAAPAMRARLGQAAARAIAARWSWTARARELEEVLRQLAP
ncbi:MAG: glycosyltransferase family 4 protein [Alphaproteobacteria bacterium]|nr:glycosyltransferase family 4 protein [Alphaproteobacteria bacterium]